MLPRQLHRVRFQPRADALAANSLGHTQVADAAEIPRQRQLGDEMQQNDTHHPLAIHGNRSTASGWANSCAMRCSMKLSVSG